MNASKQFGWIFVVCTATLPVHGRARAGAGIAAVTRPSADVTLSFVQPGRIERVYIKEGDAVKADQVLVQQDDAVDRARLAQFEADSKNMANIKAGQATLAQKKVDLQKLETAAAREAATELEVEHARLDVRIAELSLELAIFQHQQAVRKYEEVQLQIHNMSLKSPIDGHVEKVEFEAGESVNALESVVQVVQIDPLWIDVPVPLAQASTLVRDRVAQVHFSGSKGLSADGKIVFLAAVADAGSGTLRVKVEVPNKTRRPAGEHVTVVFPTQ